MTLRQTAQQTARMLHRIGQRTERILYEHGFNPKFQQRMRQQQRELSQRLAVVQAAMAASSVFTAPGQSQLAFAFEE